MNYVAPKDGLMQCSPEVTYFKIRVAGISPGTSRTPLNRSVWDTRRRYSP